MEIDVKIHKEIYKKYPSIPLGHKKKIIKKIKRFIDKNPNLSYKLGDVVRSIVVSYIRHECTEYDRMVTDENRLLLRKKLSGDIKNIVDKWRYYVEK